VPQNFSFRASRSRVSILVVRPSVVRLARITSERFARFAPNSTLASVGASLFPEKILHKMINMINAALRLSL
jgi:hypothetical protein